MVFLVADQLLIFDRVQQTITILVNAFLDEAENPADAYENATSEIERLVSLLEQPSEHIPVSVPNEVPEVAFASNITREKFCANVLAAKKLITAGDIIQVVGPQRFSAPVTASPMDVYRAVRSINPSPYMFLLELRASPSSARRPKCMCAARRARWRSGPSPAPGGGAPARRRI